MLKKTFILINVLITIGFGQNITLIDFGADSSTNSFGLNEWNEVILSDNQIYVSDIVSGVVVNDPDPSEFSDFRGIRGNDIEFSIGDRVAVTWYNRSEEIIVFTSRISFSDMNTPDLNDSTNQWFTMRSFTDYRQTFTEILPGENTITVFNIEDDGVHKCDGLHASVNINLAIEWGSSYQKQFLICDKIELLRDADISAPSIPQNLQMVDATDSQVELSWNESNDNVETVEYLIFLDGEIEGYSRENNYRCFYLSPSSTYSITVSALDACGNESEQSESITVNTDNYQGTNDLFNPAGINYLGSFAVPEDFAWGGEAIEYRENGNDGNGSLFITNLNQPENGLVGEISIPAPIISNNPAVLPTADVITTPTNIRPETVNNWDYVDIWRTGLEFHPTENRLYSSWSIHYTVSGNKHASISFCDADDMAGSEKYGAWYLGSPNQPPIDAAMNDWLFSLPKSWANQNCNGRNMVVGRCRDGGLSGLGPTLYAFSDFGNDIPATESELAFTTLLEYGSVEGTNNYDYPNSINGYKHSDDWREALWVNADGQTAVAIIGNKALGDNWYGYTGENLHHDWVYADVPYPEMYESDPDGKGWRAHDLQPMIIFFNPADLINIAKGNMESYEPQPYAAFRIDKDIFLGENHEIFSAAVDTVNDLLFITEFVRELEGNLFVHVWKTDYIENSISPLSLPISFELSQNYPNPFNPSTTIDFHIPQTAHTSLMIYNLQGQLVQKLIDQKLAGGYHKVLFNANELASGSYFYKLTAGKFTDTKQCILIK